MKTLTITDAKKNLGKWLQAAAKGEDVAIISGADIIALRKVEVEANDYAWREYGLTADEVGAYERRVNARYEQHKRTGKNQVLTADDVSQRIAESKLLADKDAVQAAKSAAGRRALELAGRK